MIDELHAQNVALIRDATIEPAAGLTVLTGETGAGKTALLSALKLLVGERSDAGMVREGTDGLVVEGRLFMEGSPNGEEGTVVRRRVDAGGRGRVTIDGRMASVHELAESVGTTVDLCGQHEHQRLLRQQTHAELLDAWTGENADGAKNAYRAALAEAGEAARELERIRNITRHADERADEAAFVLRRIDEVRPSADELAELEEALPRAEHAEALLRAASEARESLVSDGGALDALGDAADALDDAATYDSALSIHANALRSAAIDIEDVAHSLRAYADSVDVDPGALNEMQARMAALQGIMRTYGPRLEDVLNRRAAAEEIVIAARDGNTTEKAAADAVTQAERRLADTARRLDEVRAAAAPKLAAAVSAELAGLKMGTAEIEIAIDPLPRDRWTTSGPSRVELLYRPATGMLARPLRRIASGGEISRVMLACKVVLGTNDKASTLVFDEVDAGVGGATAVALAAVLARLAESHQVIVVTHLAQVATRAERHYVVRKLSTDTSGTPETVIARVDGDERVAEIARMLSGDASEASLAHAREMLSER